MRDLLAGRGVLLTRAVDDDRALAAELTALGARVHSYPCIRTEPLDDTTALETALQRLTPDDRLVITSRAGADAVAAHAHVPFSAPVAAIGTATAERLSRHGIAVDVVASDARGATLAHELPLPPGRVVLARSDRALPDLPALLRERGADVVEVVAYRTVPGASVDPAAVRAALRSGAIDVIVFASPSAVDGLVEAVGRDDARRAIAVSIGETSAARVRARIGVDAIAAERPEVASIVAAVSLAARGVHAARA